MTLFLCLVFLTVRCALVGQACDKGFQWERAVELLERMVERDGVKPNLFAYNHAMSACVRCVSYFYLRRACIFCLASCFTHTFLLPPPPPPKERGNFACFHMYVSWGIHCVRCGTCSVFGGVFLLSLSLVVSSFCRCLCLGLPFVSPPGESNRRIYITLRGHSFKERHSLAVVCFLCLAPGFSSPKPLSPFLYSSISRFSSLYFPQYLRVRLVNFFSVF